MFCIWRVVPRIGVDIPFDLGAFHRCSLQQFVTDRCLINVPRRNGHRRRERIQSILKHIRRHDSGLSSQGWICHVTCHTVLYAFEGRQQLMVPAWSLCVDLQKVFVDHLVERGGLVTPETSTPACPVLVPLTVSFFGRSRRGFLDCVLPLCNLQANGVHVVALDEARTESVVHFQQQTYFWHGSSSVPTCSQHCRSSHGRFSMLMVSNGRDAKNETWVMSRMSQWISMNRMNPLEFNCFMWGVPAQDRHRRSRAPSTPQRGGVQLRHGSVHESVTRSSQTTGQGSSESR